MKSFVNIPPEDLIIAKVHVAKDGLALGLQSAEQPDGWSDPTYERAHYLWSSTEVCRILLRDNFFLRNITGVIKKINSSKILANGIVGWETDGGAGTISTFVTRDVGALFLQIGLTTNLEEVLQNIHKLQNPDGGWGVCDGDKLSKTRATSFILTFLADCLASPLAHTYVNLDSYSAGLKWLYNAQIDTWGWANISDTPPDNISATAIALDALLSSLMLKRNRADLQIPIREQNVKQGIERLLSFCNKNGYRGFREELLIDLPLGKQYKHTAGGLGGSVIGVTLSKAAFLNYIEIQNRQLQDCIQDILTRTKQYNQKQGAWLVPSDDNGPPTAWNTAFALEALIEFERTYAFYVRKGTIEDTFIQQAEKTARRWKQWSVALAILTSVIFLARYTTSLGVIASLFNSQSPLAQGLIMIFVTLAIERSVSLIGKYAKPIFIKLSSSSSKAK